MTLLEVNILGKIKRNPHYLDRKGDTYTYLKMIL